ncbi:type VII secretion protein EccB [Nocardioides campestrisoli]|uniref:type VII secretion protein EccB n=1 Tax=Nocardioides campestrisoli TaxID=2736757 RepID=UPI0015E640D9|nr:type VII secretion protein EccB [Nocardioides campestrisoli]
MATKKELVEAYQFSRRRLVTAFLSGAPGGREVEPTKPVRSLVGGIALAVLLCAGAGVAGYLGGRPNSDWKAEGSFVISKDTGEQYVVLRGGDDPVIQRVPNFISGQLLLGTAEPDVYTVKDEHIRSVTLGGDLGIERAPAGLPGPSELITSGWTACTAERRGIKVHLAASSDAEPAPQAAFVVRSRSGALWLLAASPAGPAYRFELPTGATAQSTLLDSLGFGASSQAPEVDDSWLNLFPLGPALTEQAFGVTRGGEPVDYPTQGVDGNTDLSGYRIGDLVRSGESFYLLGDTGPQILRAFPAVLYTALVADPLELPTGLRAPREEAGHPSEWPLETPEPLVGAEMCAMLDVEDGVSHTVVATNPGSSASATQEPVAAGSHQVVVEPAGGAYVLAGGSNAGRSGSPYVVDAKGAKYALLGPAVPDYIGYGEVEAPVVPDAWLAFFPDGVPLSVNAARGLPEDAPAGAEAAS